MQILLCPHIYFKTIYQSFGFSDMIPLNQYYKEGSLNMRKFFLFLFPLILLSGCGSNPSGIDTWQDETEFGDINLEAPTIDTNDVAATYEIDRYLEIDELNDTAPDCITMDSFRIYYNRIAKQAGIPYVMPTGYESEDVGSMEIRAYEESGTGVYITLDKDSGMVAGVSCEFKFSEEEFYESINRIMAPIFGGMPNMKKFDLDKAYFEIAAAMEEKEGKYSFGFGKSKADIRRDYGYVYVNISYE